MVDFADNAIPAYAILSHRWGDKETSYQEYMNVAPEERSSFAKIRGLCTLASSRGWEWVWIDTCCIDKKSSAELSEAINSMYNWYRKSVECYVYLCDVEWNSQDMDKSLREFQRSVWFTRGWTLQELLAPGRVLFFDRHWKGIGDKHNLSNEISTITGISLQSLLSKNRPEESVAIVMSWASKRVTSRVEDTAYCLMGLFDVNMPLLYGEGEKAFERLQLAIIQATSDESIFAWYDPKLRHSSSYDYFGILARSPSQFGHSRDIVGILRANDTAPRPPYSMTNLGLAIKVPSSLLPPDKSVDSFELPLDCMNEEKLRKNPVNPKVKSILLRRGGWNGLWFRLRCDELGESSFLRVTDNDPTIYIRSK